MDTSLAALANPISDAPEATPSPATPSEEEAQHGELSPGSVAEVVARLTIWARRAPKGLALVEFDSEFSRRAAQERLEQNLRYANVPFHAITLPTQQPAADVLRDWLAQSRDVKSGVVSVTGFATAFAENPPSPDDLRILNFNRENLARFEVCQIWWVTRAFAEAMMRAAPDLVSWFLVRLRLLEQVAPLDDLPGGFGAKLMTLFLGDPLRASAHYELSLERAIEKGEPEDTLQALAAGAVAPWLASGLEKEARLTAFELANRITATMNETEVISGKAERILDGARLVVEMSVADFDKHFRLGIRELAIEATQKGEHAKAEMHFQRALQAERVAYGPEHLEVATTEAALSANYLQQGRNTEALPLMRHALAVYEKYLGAKHWRVASVTYNLGALLFHEKRYEEAEGSLRKALIAAEDNYGKEDPQILQPLELYSLVLFLNDKDAKAEELESRSRAIRKLHNLPDADTSLPDSE